jgi:hypothetical protein
MDKSTATELGALSDGWHVVAAHVSLIDDKS